MPLAFFALETAFLLALFSRDVFASAFLTFFLFPDQSWPVVAGVASGLLVATALKTRVLVPLDVLRARRPTHWFGAIFTLASACIPVLVQLLVANDLDALDLVWAIIVLVALSLALAAALFAPWGGLFLARLRPQYTDGGVGLEPAKFAVEFAFYVALLLALPLLWTAIPWAEDIEFVGGIVTLAARIAGFVLLYFVCERRFAMSKTHFARTETTLRWAEFCGVVGLLDALGFVVAILFSRYREWPSSVLIVTLFTLYAVSAIALGVWLEGRALEPKAKPIGRLTSRARARALQSLTG